VVSRSLALGVVGVFEEVLILESFLGMATTKRISHIQKPSIIGAIRHVLETGNSRVTPEAARRHAPEATICSQLLLRIHSYHKREKDIKTKRRRRRRRRRRGSRRTIEVIESLIGVLRPDLTGVARVAASALCLEIARRSTAVRAHLPSTEAPNHTILSEDKSLLYHHFGNDNIKIKSVVGFY